jgi:hypothetical protein
MRQLKGLGYMYAARTGAYANPKRLQRVCVGALLTVMGIYIYSGSWWWASTPFLFFILLMVMGALRGIHGFRRSKAAADAARWSDEYCSLRPEAASTPLPRWARGSGSGAYAWLIGLQNPAQVYIEAWPEVLLWDCVEQARLADTMTQAWCHMEGEVDRELVDFAYHVRRPHSQKELNDLSDEDALLLTRRVGNMAWCALYGPESTRRFCQEAMVTVCRDPHAPPCVWDNVLAHHTGNRRGREDDRRRRRRRRSRKHGHTFSASSSSNTSCADESSNSSSNSSSEKKMKKDRQESCESTKDSKRG